MANSEKTTKTTPHETNPVKKFGLMTLFWFAVMTISNIMIFRLFLPQWSRILRGVSQAGQAALTSGVTTAEIIIDEATVAPEDRVATISATFLSDLISAIMEATTEAELASAEADLIEAL